VGEKEERSNNNKKDKAQGGITSIERRCATLATVHVQKHLCGGTLLLLRRDVIIVICPLDATSVLCLSLSLSTL
jgi:hypothetical protein